MGEIWMKEIEWFNAKKVHPAKNGWVVVMTERDNELSTVMSILYEDGYFNGKAAPFEDVVCWAYESDFEDAFNVFKRGDDF